MNNISRTGFNAAVQPPKMRPLASKQTPAHQAPQQPAQSMSTPQANLGAKINYLA